MNWQEFTALLVMAAAMSFSPGPDTTLSTTLAANGGLPRAMRFVLAVPVGFGRGVMRQFLNVKAWLLALTRVAGWIAGHPDALHRYAIVAPVMVVYAFVSNFVYALAGSLLRGWLAEGSRLLWFNRAMAIVLVLTAAWMVGA